jgi:hypothetical protein
MDRSAIFSGILERNELRRAAQLPPLPVRETYEREITAAEWRSFCDQHAAFVRDQILAERRATYPDWGNSAGGQLALGLLTEKRLRERFGQQRSSSALPTA